MKPTGKPSKRGVDRELDSVEEFLESLDELFDAQLLEIHAAWTSRDQEAYDRAWSAAVAAAARYGITSEMEKVRDATIQWATRGTNVPWPYGFDEASRADVRRQAAPALADAAVALLLGGRLDEESGETLIGPWRRAADTSA